MHFTLFTDFFQKIDGATAHFVTEISARSISTVAPFVGIGLTLMFISFALLIMRGAVDMPLMEFLGKALRIGIITSIALSGGIYQSEIAEVLNKLPDDLAQSLIMDKRAQPNGAAGLMDNAFLHTFSLAADALKSAATIKIGVALGYLAVGICIVLTGGILFGVGIALLVAIKVIMAILAGLGPIFIIALLFRPTERLFEAWTAQLMNYTFLMVIFSATFGFLMDIYGSFMSQIKLDGIANIAYCLGASVSLAIVTLVLLFQLPSLASSLAGGLSLSFRREGRSATNSLKSSGRAAKGAAVMTGRGVMSTGRAGMNLVRGRARG